jgi:hypothetical protein
VEDVRNAHKNLIGWSEEKKIIGTNSISVDHTEIGCHIVNYVCLA